MSHFPTTWDEVENCECRDCRALWSIHQRCEELSEPLFVCDVRRFGQGWAVTDSRRLFFEVAALRTYPVLKQAVADVIAQQNHCDLFVELPSGWQAIFIEARPLVRKLA